MYNKTFPSQDFGNNTTVFWNDKKEAFVSDPCISIDETLDFIKSEKLTVKAVIMTHGHLDHSIGSIKIHEAFPEAHIYLNEGDKDVYFGSIDYAASFGMKIEGEMPQFTNFPEGKDIELIAGVTACGVVYTGHTPGHLVIMIKENDSIVFVLTGDMVLANNIPGKFEFSYDIDLHNEGIKKIAQLNIPDDVKVIPGHGDHCTFKDIKNCPLIVKSE